MGERDVADAIAAALLHRIADWPEGTLEGRRLRTGPAARYLGVSQNTLRSWEARYGFPAPERDGSRSASGGPGCRLYNPAQIVLLKEALFRADGDGVTAMALLRADIERRDGERPRG